MVNNYMVLVEGIIFALAASRFFPTATPIDSFLVGALILMAFMLGWAAREREW